MTKSSSKSTFTLLLLLALPTDATSADGAHLPGLYMHEETEHGFLRAIAAVAYSIPPESRSLLTFEEYYHPPTFCARVRVASGVTADPAFGSLRQAAQSSHVIIVAAVGASFDLPLLERDDPVSGRLRPLRVSGAALRLGKGVWGISAPPCQIRSAGAACSEGKSTIAYVARNQDAVSLAKTIQHEILHEVLRLLDLPHLHGEGVDRQFAWLEHHVAVNVRRGLYQQHRGPIRLERAARFWIFRYYRVTRSEDLGRILVRIPNAVEAPGL